MPLLFVLAYYSALEMQGTADDQKIAQIATLTEYCLISGAMFTVNDEEGSYTCYCIGSLCFHHISGRLPIRLLDEIVDDPT